MSVVSTRVPHSNSVAFSHAGCTVCGYDHDTYESPVIAYAVIYRGRLYRLENPFKAYIKCKSYLNPKEISYPRINNQAILFEKLLLARMEDDIKVHEQRDMYGPWPRWWRINAFKYARQRVKAEGREVLQQPGFERYELVWGRCALGWETDVGHAKKELWRPRTSRWWHTIATEKVEADRKRRHEAEAWVAGEVDEGYNTSASSGSEGKHSTDRLLPESKETVPPVSNTRPKEDKCFCCHHV